MSLTSSHALSMSQQANTTVSKVSRSPASEAAMASSISANPASVSPLPTRISPSCDNATSSRSTSRAALAICTAHPVSSSASSRSVIR